VTRPSAPPAASTFRRCGARPRRERGAALLVVLLVVAVLTALAVDLAYGTRVSLQIAVNARDELRATYQARSAVSLARLVLHFQQQLDGAANVSAQAMARMAGGAQPATPQSFSFRLWEAVPVDSSVASMFLGARPREPVRKEAEPAAKPGAPAPGPGDAGEAFQARIEDEERKVNVAQLAGLSAMAGPQLQRFLLTARDPRYDVLFDREDANGGRFSRRDVAAALKDWVDEDGTTSAVGSNPAQPFEDAFGDENLAYDRGEERYRAKNARFDSLDELYLLSGISDAFMAAFGDQLTVYPDVNAPTNVNNADPDQQTVNILLMSDPPGIPQPALLDPAFAQKLDAALRLARPLPFMTLSVPQFAGILQALGIRVQPVFLQAQSTDSRNPFGSRSSTFTVRATGRAGPVEKDIEAVVAMDGRAGPLAQDLGRIIHWRED